MTAAAVFDFAIPAALVVAATAAATFTLSMFTIPAATISTAMVVVSFVFATAAMIITSFVFATTAVVIGCIAIVVDRAVAAKLHAVGV